MKTLVVMPTFNESENLEWMAERVLGANPNVDLLVVDDNSPDGTGDIADRLAAGNARVKVLHRSGKEGLGSAYRAGFDWGMKAGYEALVEMDADGSHQPEQLPPLLDALGEADVVLGSRWTSGGSVVNWPLHRKLLSKGGSLYARLLLGFKTKDATGGYRVFRASAIQEMQLLESRAQGYVFQVDSTYRAYRKQLRVRELPIEFVERSAGQSKMSRRIVFEAMWQVTLWAWRYRVLRKPL